jgi:hypothetical protein
MPSKGGKQRVRRAAAQGKASADSSEALPTTKVDSFGALVSFRRASYCQGDKRRLVDMPMLGVFEKDDGVSELGWSENNHSTHDWCAHV